MQPPSQTELEQAPRVSAPHLETADMDTQVKKIILVSAKMAPFF